ncbi:MAG: S8/S53 family peptidase, partial [Acidobacteria bacterium]|nr:S8/S53 family peptidase [Acidobacteriota bacterium]
MNKTSFLICLTISLLCAPIFYSDNQELTTFTGYQILSPSKIDHYLFKTLSIYKSQGVEAAEKFAASKGFKIENGFVRLEVLPPQSGSPIMPNHFHNKLGIFFKAKGRLENNSTPGLLNGAVHLSQIEELASLPEVGLIRFPIKSFYNDIISEGVENINANIWQNLESYRTFQHPIKIAIVDGGFFDYENLLGTELPREVTTISFAPDNSMGTSPHGTGMAEIVHDVFPEAELYLVRIYDVNDYNEAVLYCADNNIKIVSCSMGSTLSGAGDGTGWRCEAMRNARNRGIHWFNAAGNDADDHWMGYFNDPDNDGWHNFTDGDEIIELSESTIDWCFLVLDWEDWGEWNGVNYNPSGVDYDLFFYKYTNGDWQLIDSSETRQNGNNLPYEYISLDERDSHTRYGAAIRKIRDTKNTKLHLLTPNQR